MASFVHPGLLWGLAILAVPILIHLINLMRHRRVQWAAMEFLLVSREEQHLDSLKELLLLLLRLAVVAAVVLMLAQPLLQNQWGRLFGGGKTHHIVLLDDSFSMSDRWGDTSAFDEAKRLIERSGRAGRASVDAANLYAAAFQPGQRDSGQRVRPARRARRLPTSTSSSTRGYGAWSLRRKRLAPVRRCERVDGTAARTNGRRCRRIRRVGFSRSRLARSGRRGR